MAQVKREELSNKESSSNFVPFSSDSSSESSSVFIPFTFDTEEKKTKKMPKNPYLMRKRKPEGDIVGADDTLKV